MSSIKDKEVYIVMREIQAKITNEFKIFKKKFQQRLSKFPRITPGLGHFRYYIRTHTRIETVTHTHIYIYTQYKNTKLYWSLNYCILEPSKTQQYSLQQQVLEVQGSQLVPTSEVVLGGEVDEVLG